MAWLARHSAAPSAVIGAAVRLHGACASLLNGGRFAGAHLWDDRRWLTSAAIDRDEVNALVDAGLAEWVDYDLVLLDYDREREDTYKAQCDRAAKAREEAERNR